MDIIRPQEETVETPFTDGEVSVNPINQNAIEALKYLDLTQSLYNDEIMEKVSEIIEFTGSGDLQELDIKLGNPYGMSRLDKIYSYVRLMKQSEDLQKRESLLEQERTKYTYNSL